MKKSLINYDDLHSEDIREIIKKPPSWLLTRGITVILFALLSVVFISTFISYPETIQTQLKFNTLDAPKAIVSKIDGNIVELLVKDEAFVKVGEELAFLESTADHKQVLKLLNNLYQFRADHKSKYDIENLISPLELNLGELQSSYQNFYTAYLNFRSANDGGIYYRRKDALEKQLINIQKQYEKSIQSLEYQKQQLKFSEIEFEKYKILAEKKVISPSELQQKELKLIAEKQTIPQMESNIISFDGNLLSKHKELTDLDNQITEEQKKFVQSLNSFISEAENWKNKYVLTSSVKGKLIYGSFLQENQQVSINQKMFYVNPNNEKYYGEALLQEDASAKVRIGQSVLIKVRSYPYQEYGYIHGKINYISEIPIKDSVFFTKVELIRTKEDSLIKLKPGILADAEIITINKSIFKRLWENLMKNMKF
jgi:HlyD family secretion protein